MKLHERLYMLRATKKMTQAEVAEHLHVTRQTISSYESGRTEPDIETLRCLADLYDVPVQDFLNLKDRAVRGKKGCNGF